MKKQIKEIMKSKTLVGSVITALAVVVAALIGALVPSCTELSRTKRENLVLSTENKRLSEELAPFKTVALMKFGSQDSNAILALATNLLSIQKELNAVHVITTNIANRTSIIRNLPDGRTLVGDIVTGEPSYVMSLQSEAVENYNRRLFTNAIACAKELVQRYESTKFESQNAVLEFQGAEIQRILANMYSLILEESMAAGDYDGALRYAERAVQLDPSPLHDALKTTVLSNRKDFSEVEKMIDLYQKKTQDQRNAFFGFLIQYGYLLPKLGSDCNFDLLKKEFDLSIELKTPSAYRIMKPMGAYTNASVFVNRWLGLDKVQPLFYEQTRVK